MNLNEKRDLSKLLTTEKLKVGDSEIRMAEVLAAQPSGKHSVVFIPGMGAPLEAAGPALVELSRLGRRAISFQHNADERPLILPPETIRSLKKEGYTENQIRKAEDVIAVLDAKGITAESPADLIGHSNGAIIASIVGLLQPERIKNILFLAPAGMIPGDTSVHLAARGGLDKLSKKLPENVKKLVPEKVKEKLYLADKRSLRDKSEWANPIPEEDRQRIEKGEGTLYMPEYKAIEPTETSRYVGAAGEKSMDEHLEKNKMFSAKETLGMGWTRLIPILPKLRAKGIGLLAMSGVDDPLFPTKYLSENLPAKTMGFLSVRGDHVVLQEHPEIYIPQAENMLTQIDRAKHSEYFSGNP